MPAAWVSAIAGIASAANQADASRSAAGAQVGSSKESIAAQKGQIAQARSDNAQFLQTGTSANARLAQLLGLPGQVDPNDPKFKAIYDKKVADLDALHKEQYSGRSIFDSTADVSQRQTLLDNIKKQSTDEYVKQYGDPSQSGDGGSLLRKFSTADLNADPVYQSGLQFGLDQGTGAINARAVATGNYDSGATLKALTRYGNDYGSTKAEGAYNRYNADNTNIFNKLSGISGTGQVASNQVTSAGTAATNQISNDITGAGNARAAGIVGGANAWGGAANSAATAYQTYDNNQRYKALTNNASNYTSSGTFAPTYTGSSADGSYAYG